MSRPVHFTHHARDRYVERHRKNPADLVKSRLDRSVVDRELAALFDAADEHKAWLNDTEFTGYLYRRYGYDKRFRFHVHRTKRLVFVVVEEHNADVVVTIYKDAR